MLKQRVKLTVVGEPIAYPKKENGMIVKDENGNDVTAGYRRQVIFESRDFKKDTLLFTLFSESPEPFPFSAGTEGELQFQCELREAKTQDGETRIYSEFRLINFIPTY